MIPIAYAKLGAVLGVAGLLLWGALWFRGVIADRDKALADNVTLTAAHAAAMNTVKVLQAQGLRDAAAAAELARAKAKAEARERATSRRLADLGRENADVRTYLAAPVPPDLASVLSDADSDPAGDDHPAPAGVAAPAVRAPEPPAPADHG